MALAVWAGALVGLACGANGTGALWWAGLLLVLCAVVLSTRRPSLSAGVWTATGGFVAAVSIALMTWQAAAHNPLTTGAADGSWAFVKITVTTAPRQIASPVPVAPDPSRSGALATQWLVGARADDAVIAGMGFDPGMAVSVMATGVGWGRLVPGEQVQVGGLLTPDTFSVLPGVVLEARTEPSTTHAAPWWQRWAASIRLRLIESAAGLPPDARGLLPGLVVGNTDAIPPDLAADGKVTGLTHLLAVSGSHFALLCGLAILLLRRVGPRVAAAGGALVLLALVVLVGPGASVLRAAVMGSIALVAMSVGRNRTALPALAGAMICLLFYDPTLSRSVGFTLSVQATAGLVLLAPAWSKALQRRGWPAGWADLVAVPAAAQVATTPVVAALSGAVSLSSIPANLLAALVVAPALVIGMCCALTGVWWPAGAEVLARADEPLLNWIAAVAHRLAHTQFAAVAWPASLPGVLALSGVLIVGLLLLRHHRVRALALAIAVGAGVVVVPAQVVSPGWPPPGWVLVACEVGQGDGMVLSTGEPGTAVVVDAGPDPALMDACLTRLHISTVPLVILTHLHADHINGVAGVLTGRSIGAVGVSPYRNAPAAWARVHGLAAQHQIPVVELPKGTKWGSALLSFEVLSPGRPFLGTDSDEANDSVVLMARTAGIKILMTGDAESDAQQRLLDERIDLRADVLEQPHHGSAKVLPAFVQAVRPRVSAIGVGQDNDYGHPTPTALGQLASVGAVVLRTDLQGDAAVCLIDGRLSTVTRGASLRAPPSKVEGGPAVTDHG